MDPRLLDHWLVECDILDGTNSDTYDIPLTCFQFLDWIPYKCNMYNHSSLGWNSKIRFIICSRAVAASWKLGVPRISGGAQTPIKSIFWGFYCIFMWQCFEDYENWGCTSTPGTRDTTPLICSNKFLWSIHPSFDQYSAKIKEYHTFFKNFVKSFLLRLV